MKDFIDGFLTVGALLIFIAILFTIALLLLLVAIYSYNHLGTIGAIIMTSLSVMIIGGLINYLDNR